MQALTCQARPRDASRFVQAAFLRRLVVARARPVQHASARVAGAHAAIRLRAAARQVAKLTLAHLASDGGDGAGAEQGGSTHYLDEEDG